MIGDTGIGEASIRRHAEHIPRTLALAAQAAEETRADDLMERTRGLETDARRLLAKAEREGDFRAAIAAVRAALDVVELLHRVASERKAEAGALLSSPEWFALRDRIADALEPFPEAMEAVRLACLELTEDPSRLVPRVRVTLRLPAPGQAFEA